METIGILTVAVVVAAIVVVMNVLQLWLVYGLWPISWGWLTLIAAVSLGVGLLKAYLEEK